MIVYTIGHSNHTWEPFVALLRQHEIKVLVDVRSKPVSRFAAFANRRRLPSLLEEVCISYAYLGDFVGGKPNDPSCYDGQGRPDYAKMASRGTFREGMDDLLVLTRQGPRTALMCAEEDPVKCHRRLLIGPALEEHGVTLVHIRKNGTTTNQ